MSWSGHWHGYGPWTGSRNAYGQESLRRPGLSAGDEQTRTFIASTLPPLMIGHWLLRTQQTSADRTWTAAANAVAWLRSTYAVNPPMERDDGGQAYESLDVKLMYAGDSLPRGVDVAWVYYAKSSHLVSFAVVCCANRHHPTIPCPRPPALRHG